MQMLQRILLSLSIAAMPACAFSQAPTTKPNVIYIYGDDVGYGDLSCNGAKTISTPHIDQLAKEGLLLTNMHSSAATCTPSRYALMTGEYAWRRQGTGIAAGNAGSIIRPERFTLGKVFKAAGYRTAAIGKWHLGLGDRTGTQDWNGFISPGPADIGFDESFILAATGDRVPCVYVQNGRVVNLDPADPISVSYDQNFDGQPTGKSNPELLTLHPSHGHDMSIVHGISRIGYMKGGKSALWKDDEISTEITAKALQFIGNNQHNPFFLYLATQDIHVPRVPNKQFVGKSGMGPRGDAILEFDWTVGEVMHALKKWNLDKNTIVILSSDNGPVVDDGYKDQAVELLGNHKPAGPYRGGKYSSFEGGTRVPGIVRWTGTVTPGVSDKLICQVDMLASFAKFLHVSIPTGGAPDSEDQLTAWLNRGGKGRDYLVLQNVNNNLSIENGRYKYIEPGNGPAYGANTNTEYGNSTEDQLYDLATDPGEKNNLATQYPEVITLLRTRLDQTKAGNPMQTSRRWNLTPDGGIRWKVSDPSPHIDHIEMSGLQMSAILHYGIDEQGRLTLEKKLVFPMLRTIPNNTHASLSVDFKGKDAVQLISGGTILKEYPQSFSLKGKLTVESSTNSPLSITHTLFPSIDKAALIEIIELKNTGGQSNTVEISNPSTPTLTDPAKGVYGQYIVRMDLSGDSDQTHSRSVTIAPGASFTFAAIYSGRKATDQPYSYAPAFESEKRSRMVNDIFGNLVLETPNDTINREFAFAKLRATESIYDTKGGLMHGPGGGAYYAAIWANDQAEYANPFFPFLGNLNGNESAINAYRHFSRFMNPAYKPIPSSIIAEGTDIWNGAGDRGDMAMIAYGASRFSLASGKKEMAEELWPLITWCFEYLDRKKTADGVIASDNDELEGRFYAGKINLSTNCLAYGGYVSAANLATELGKSEIAAEYRTKAQSLRKAIESYFGANVQGFDTYRYFDGNDKLRAWICIPLTMGIIERKDQTIKALFSPELWTANGILTESGSKTFWDRSTLYAFRGLLACGATNKCMPYFGYYSATRLLGEHVPYPVEAWPEGDQRHLSAESALYCRAVTEGLFGITPTGLQSFTLTPWLPKGWRYMKLKNIQAFSRSFDIEVSRRDQGEMITIKTAGKPTITMTWNGKAPLKILLP
ncbi:MAG: sulfatase-like hydrolase/transferase [Ilumatobacteraceae bacterium]